MRPRAILSSLISTVALCSSAVTLAASDIDSVAKRIARLDAQAQRLADFNAVARLQRAYGYYLDKGYWDEAANLFADAGTFESGVDGVYVGKTRIRARLIQEGGGNPGPGLPYGQINHRMQLQPVIHIAADGRSARARWRELALLGQYHAHAEWGSGIYENQYVKENGIWRIARLHYYPNFVAPYEGGWARLQAVSGDWISAAGKALPADRPVSVFYRPFPAPFTPSFHYSVANAGALSLESTAASRAAAAPTSPAGGANELRSELERAEHDLEILSSQREIQNLQAAYGYYLDKGLWDEASALFSRGGSYEYGQQGIYVGARRIRMALRLLGPAHLGQGRLNDHLMLQPIIDVAGDDRSAKARWRSDVMLAAGGRGQWGGGVYENEYVHEGGLWKIRSQHYYVTFLGDYEQGWIKAPLSVQGPSKTLPPDRPPSVVYGALPGVYLVPYHYPNPVTGAAPSIERDVDAAMLPSALRALAVRANSLAHQVELLKDEAQIEKLQRAYGYYVDKAQWPDVAALFAPQGTYEIGGRGVFVGPRRVLQYLVTGLGPIGLATRGGQLLDHQQFQGIVDVAPDGQTAKGRWTALVMAGTPGADAIWGDATYENSYVKLNGVWQASSFRAPFNMYCTYKGGWKDSSVPNTRPDSFAPPPDLPPSTVYLTYPSFYVAPYHYPNPVTGAEAPAPAAAAGGTLWSRDHATMPAAAP